MDSTPEGRIIFIPSQFLVQLKSFWPKSDYVQKQINHLKHLQRPSLLRKYTWIYFIPHFPNKKFTLFQYSPRNDKRPRTTNWIYTSMGIYKFNTELRGSLYLNKGSVLLWPFHDIKINPTSCSLKQKKTKSLIRKITNYNLSKRTSESIK